MKHLLIAAAACGLLAPAGACADSAPVVAIDPARLAAARVTANDVFPPGTYARAMNPDNNLLAKAMSAQPLRDVASAKGISYDRLAQLDDATVRQIVLVFDPQYDERLRLTTNATLAESSGVMNQFEPAVREGLARAYARRFSTKQLNELNRFFATQTGKAYASDAMAIFLDQEVANEITAMMAILSRESQEMRQRIDSATSALPSPKELGDLTPAERDRLSGLIGIPADELYPPEHFQTPSDESVEAQ